MKKYKIAMVLGIRPDIVRASRILARMRRHHRIDLKFIWSGQHYDDELKGIFFRELGVQEPEFILDATGTAIEQHSKLLIQLEEALKLIKPDACMFLGDTNTVIGCITPLKMGIPIIHVEAGMRSHDWDMPEEKNRVLIDSVSDILYTYRDEYKQKLILEGICPTKITTCGNTIFEVIQHYYQGIYSNYSRVFEKFNVKPYDYALMTLHRNENVSDELRACAILDEVSYWAWKNHTKVILIVMPRLQPIIDKYFHNDSNFIFTKPLGFFDFINLEKYAKIEFTDSGTNQETASSLGTACVVTRRSTERPDTFECGTTVMEPNNIGRAAEWLMNNRAKRNGAWSHNQLRVDGLLPSEIIVNDLIKRLDNGLDNDSRTNKFVEANWAVWS